MATKKNRVYMWQNNMCITYTMLFKRFEDFFQLNGLEITGKPEDADWVFIGACAGFIPQIEDYISKMKVLMPLKKKTAIFGCLPKITPERFKEVTPESVLYIPTNQPGIVEEIVPVLKTRWHDVVEPCGFRKQDYRKFDPGKKYIIVQYGCNAKCVYCPHIIGMGSQVSEKKERILERVRLSLANGAHTIFLEGMDSGSWGTDFSPSQSYLDMLIPILEMPGDFQIHIGQFGANWILHYQDKLLKAFCHPRITDIKIPIQSTSPRLLDLMGRDVRVKEIGCFLKHLMQHKKSLNLRTDVIIGFPTETLDELNETLQFVSEHFHEAACFGFEIHPHTPVAKMNLPFYENSLIEERVSYALKFFEQNPRMITHRGGQKQETAARESRKEELFCK